MPSAHPFPAAIDDAVAVWRAAVQMARPANMAIFGTSTGGGETLLRMRRAMAEHLALPAAIAPGTPWADLSQTGDSVQTNAFVDREAFSEIAAFCNAHLGSD